MNITKVDLSDAKSVNKSVESVRSKEELAEYELGEIVSVDGDGGIIAAVLEGEFSWPSGAEDVSPDQDRVKSVDEDEGEVTMQASEDEPLYVVALQKGGSIVAESDEIEAGGSLEGDGVSIDSWEDMGDKGVEGAELAALYERCDNPSSRIEWESEKASLIREQNAEALAEYVEGDGTSIEELAQRSPEELLNIPGVDDPGVGFDSDPNGWDRTSYLDAWATVGGMWRTCYPRMIRHFGPNMAKRWCAALKDTVLQTTEWRGEF